MRLIFEGCLTAPNSPAAVHSGFGSFVFFCEDWVCSGQSYSFVIDENEGVDSSEFAGDEEIGFFFVCEAVVVEGALDHLHVFLNERIVGNEEVIPDFLVGSKANLLDGKSSNI